ncbi:hypothetical protein GLE_0966 [Lysobacter enzymogenes]|uniref:Uncharacterized protein n=1 Tax=Lysobacter enzymogenes TaxID=69 RepID=A0A0S2DCS0_LYSEN|nr:hypothetical protein GLE_0966 [Lysobacter enzymogenes]
MTQGNEGDHGRAGPDAGAPDCGSIRWLRPPPPRASRPAARVARTRRRSGTGVGRKAHLPVAAGLRARDFERGVSAEE